jgi:hypothetical protein
VRLPFFPSSPPLPSRSQLFSPPPPLSPPSPPSSPLPPLPPRIRMRILQARLLRKDPALANLILHSLALPLSSTNSLCHEGARTEVLGAAPKLLQATLESAAVLDGLQQRSGGRPCAPEDARQHLAQAGAIEGPAACIPGEGLRREVRRDLPENASNTTIRAAHLLEWHTLPHCPPRTPRTHPHTLTS